MQNRLLLLLFFIINFTACKSPKMARTAAILSPDIVIKNVNIIDAKNGLQKGKTVFVKGNRIGKVGEADGVKFNTDKAQVIDGKGKYLLPGLWDAHVHLVFEEDLTPAMFRLFLAYGITSVRDTGGQLHLVAPEREKARKDPKNTPRVMIAGPLLDGVPTVYDGSTPFNPHLGIGAKSVEQANKNADEMIAAKVDLLKAYEMLTPEAFKAILAKGKKAGIPITGHVPLSMDAIEASNAGMNSMEHMRNLEFACATDWEDLLAKRKQMLFDGQAEKGSTLRRNIHSAQRTHAVEHQDPERRAKVLKVLADNETWQVPTMSIMMASAERFNVSPEWMETFNLLPPTVKERWTKGATKFAESPVSESLQAYANWFFEMVGHLKAAEVDIMAGTDCPIFYLTPGYSLHEELALLVKGGLTPLEAIEAATTKPAEYFKMENELGLVQEGMLADLLLLDANPLDNIRNTLKINAVIRDGKLHDQAALDTMIAGLRAGE
ncbi:MAG: amidohydrolase family protein [Bacteroidota bacterium]